MEEEEEDNEPVYFEEALDHQQVRSTHFVLVNHLDRVEVFTGLVFSSYLESKNIS